MAPIYRWVKLICIPCIGIGMPLIFYSGDDNTMLFTWCIFSILVTFVAWESGSLVSGKINKKFPLISCPGKHVLTMVLYFLLLSLLLILAIYLVNRFFNTVGYNYWSAMKGVHLIILLGTFMLTSMHEGLYIYFNWKEITLATKPEKDRQEHSIFKKNFTVQIGPKIKIIAIEDIAYIYAMDKGVYLKTFANRDYLIDETLTQVNSLVNPEVFFRINRKFIINIKSITELVTLSKSRLKILVSPSSPIEIILGYTKSSELKAWLNR